MKLRASEEQIYIFEKTQISAFSLPEEEILDDLVEEGRRFGKSQKNESKTGGEVETFRQKYLLSR